MDYLDDTPLSRKNKHLNAFERGQIQLLNSEGLSAYSIGKRLDREPRRTSRQPKTLAAGAKNLESAADR